MDLDLNTLGVAAAGFELQLTHPRTGAPLEIFITVLGADSAAYKERLLEHQRRAMADFQKTRKFARTPEQLDADAIELLAAATQAWRNVVVDGKPLTCSEAAARTLYADPRFPWIREQVDAAIGDRANFLPRSVSA